MAALLFGLAVVLLVVGIPIVTAMGLSSYVFALANGIEPINLVNVLDVDKPDEDIVDQLMQGLHAAATECIATSVTGRSWMDASHNTAPPSRTQMTGRFVTRAAT